MPEPTPADILRPGLPISQRGFGASFGGTLGCFVVDNVTGRPAILGNHHVLQFYRNTSDPAAYDIIQPWGADILSHAEELREFLLTTNTGITPDQHADLIARRCIVAVVSRGYLEPDMDAAIAPLANGVTWQNTTPTGDRIFAPPSGSWYDSLNYGQRVWKWGAASGKKKWARVTSTGMAASTSYAYFKVNTLPMPKGIKTSDKVAVPIAHTDVIEVEGEDTNEVFQVQGDSGSALCDSSNRLIGLMSTGGLGRKAYAIPIGPILERLNIAFPSPGGGISITGVSVGTGPKRKID